MYLSSPASLNTTDSSIQLFHICRGSLEEVVIRNLLRVSSQGLDLLRTALGDSAPRLRVLVLLDLTWDRNSVTGTGSASLGFDLALSRCGNLRELRLSIDTLIADPGTLFPTLSSLPHLQQIELSAAEWLNREPYKHISYSSVETFATTSTNLRSISIPHFLMREWELKGGMEKDRVKRWFRRKGVELNVED